MDIIRVVRTNAATLVADAVMAMAMQVGAARGFEATLSELEFCMTVDPGWAPRGGTNPAERGWMIQSVPD